MRPMVGMRSMRCNMIVASVPVMRSMKGVGGIEQRLRNS